MRGYRVRIFIGSIGVVMGHYYEDQYDIAVAKRNAKKVENLKFIERLIVATLSKFNDCAVGSQLQYFDLPGGSGNKNYNTIDRYKESIKHLRLALFYLSLDEEIQNKISKYAEIDNIQASVIENKN